MGTLGLICGLAVPALLAGLFYMSQRMGLRGLSDADLQAQAAEALRARNAYWNMLGDLGIRQINYTAEQLGIECERFQREIDRRRRPAKDAQ